jgi:hypothetical protein
MIVEALCLMNMKPKAGELVKKIAAELSREEWMSTQTTAYSLIAISGFTGGSASKGIHASYSVDGSPKVQVETDKAIALEALNMNASLKGGKLKMVNEGKNLLYARIILQGIPAKGDSTSSQSDLKMSVVYLSTAGKALDPSNLVQGTNFIAEVTVTNPGLRGSYEQMALTQIFPSGWEIINARMSDAAQSSTQASPFTWQDIRDDRVYTYFDIDPNRSKTFRIMLNASYLGRFYLPTTYCSAMYDNTINARTPGKWVEIKPSVK